MRVSKWAGGRASAKGKDAPDTSVHLFVLFSFGENSSDMSLVSQHSPPERSTLSPQPAERMSA